MREETICAAGQQESHWGYMSSWLLSVVKLGVVFNMDRSEGSWTLLEEAHLKQGIPVFFQVRQIRQVKQAVCVVLPGAAGCMSVPILLLILCLGQIAPRENSEMADR